MRVVFEFLRYIKYESKLGTTTKVLGVSRDVINRSALLFCYLDKYGQLLNLLPSLWLLWPLWLLSLFPTLIIFSSNTCWSAFAVDWLLRSDTSHHQRLLYCLHWVWALPQNARISLPDHICQRSPVNALLRLKPRFLTSVWGNFDFDLILLSLQISNLHHLSIHFGFAIFTTFQPSFTWNDAKWDS